MADEPNDCERQRRPPQNLYREQTKQEKHHSQNQEENHFVSDLPGKGVTHSVALSRHAGVTRLLNSD
jgi:hypothetical protein